MTIQRPSGRFFIEASIMLKTISHAELLRLVHYDPETGIITWKVRRSNRVMAGHVAGKVHKKTGYREIIIDRRYYLAHRLAWFYAHGTWPERIDHRDGDKLNNRIENLREATVSQNAANKKMNITNRCGFKGVRATENNRWRATIETNSKSYSLGTFDTPEEAHAAYVNAAKRLFGEFARAA
jgi:hypothetical protein